MSRGRLRSSRWRPCRSLSPSAREDVSRPPRRHPPCSLRRRPAVDIIRAPPERHPPLAEGHVKSLIGQLGPLLGNKLNVVYDLTVVMIAAVAAARLAGRNVDPQLLACAGCLALCWSVESFVVRYYDRWANRSRLGEIALVCLLAVGLAVTPGTIHLVVPCSNLPAGTTPF